jgi:hypothetical protein
VIVGPRGLPSELAACLSGAVATVLASATVKRVAGASLDPALAATALADAEAAAAEAAALVPLIKPALQKIRS